MSDSTAGHIVYRDHKFFGFRFRSDLIARDYMRRWTFETPIGAIRIHNILRSDSDRHFHDHPFNFMSLILRGGYVEHRPHREPRACWPGDLVFHRAEDLHYLKIPPHIESGNGGTWTLVFAGNERRPWGFHTEDGWIPAGAYDEYLSERL